jgi:hypothetical protein
MEMKSRIKVQEYGRIDMAKMAIPMLYRLKHNFLAMSRVLVVHRNAGINGYVIALTDGMGGF